MFSFLFLIYLVAKFSFYENIDSFGHSHLKGVKFQTRFIIYKLNCGKVDTAIFQENKYN